METIQDIVKQEMIEERFNRKHINKKVKEFILEHGMEHVQEGIGFINAWLEEEHYESKRIRLGQLREMDLEELVIKMLINILPIAKPELFTSVSAQLAGKLGWNDKPSAIVTAAELLAVLSQTKLFSIYREKSNIYIRSNVPLPENLQHFIERSAYLPPMVCKPLELESNYSSGYLTHKDSLILQNNHHNGNICLDVLNLMNSVPLKLNLDFLDKVAEKPTKKPEDQEQQEQWDAFKKHSHEMYKLMVENGNRFYLTHKVDKRGRIYSCGYHINTQGTPYKKASIELANEELIEVPQEFLEV